MMTACSKTCNVPPQQKWLGKRMAGRSDCGVEWHVSQGAGFVCLAARMPEVAALVNPAISAYLYRKLV
jgi:hypothetical protein